MYRLIQLILLSILLTGCLAESADENTTIINPPEEHQDNNGTGSDNDSGDKSNSSGNSDSGENSNSGDNSNSGENSNSGDNSNSGNNQNTGNDDNYNPNLNWNYAIQLIASDYSSAAVAFGNMNGDRSVKKTTLITSSSDYTISTYKNFLYHIGRYGVDTATKYDASVGFNNSVWSYSTNENGGFLSNPNKIIQISDDRAYLLRIEEADLLEINPKATRAQDFFVDRIDLSAYSPEGVSSPDMINAAYYNGKLLIVLQRINESWEPEQAYLAVIDTSDNEEIDTGKDNNGLKGIPLNATNPMNFPIDMKNGVMFIAGRGSYFDRTRIGALDKIDLTTYEVTKIADYNSFPDLNNAIMADVAVVDDNNGYILVTEEDEISLQTLNSYLYPFNPSTGSIRATPLDIPAIDGKMVSDIALAPDERLWIGISDDSDPKVVVFDTDTNTQSGNAILLDMKPLQIEFLTTN